MLRVNQVVDPHLIPILTEQLSRVGIKLALAVGDDWKPAFSALPASQHLRRHFFQGKGLFVPCQKHAKAYNVQLFAVDGEHAGGFADAHRLFSGEPPVDIARQRGEVGYILPWASPLSIAWYKWAILQR